MPIAPEDVRRVAELARLDLSDDERARLGADLERIVAFVEQLQRANTNGVEPIANVSGLERVTRPDIARAMFSPQELLAGAPQASEVAFLVPKAVER